MKDRGSSAEASKSWSIFARLSLRISSSSSSESSSSRTLSGAGPGSAPTVRPRRAPPCGGVAASPGRPTTSEFVPSSSTPTCRSRRRRRPAPKSCIDRTFRILRRFSLSAGSVAFLRFWKQPDPSRYHGFLAHALIAMPGRTLSSKGFPFEQGFSLRFSTRRDWKSLRAERLLALAISFDDRSSSSRCRKYDRPSPPGPGASAASSFTLLMRFEARESLLSWGTASRARHWMNCTISFASRMSSSRALKPQRSSSGGTEEMQFEERSSRSRLGSAASWPSTSPWSSLKERSRDRRCRRAAAGTATELMALHARHRQPSLGMLDSCWSTCS
mmetsp:Transcript_47811/g.138225  ORF Transcript_47811/g.138225 Transcript_47811/m.138225 type:complete len:330 (+) Transcript_47811:215-1204(+)